jgi:hypothetical protein
LKKDEQEKAMNKQYPKNSTEGTSSQTPTSQQEDAPVTTTHEISVSGDVYFAGAALPTTEQLDDVTAASFEGDAGNEFIQDLSQLMTQTHNYTKAFFLQIKRRLLLQIMHSILCM